MRPTLSRAPGMILCAALAFTPNLAWAAPSPVRTNLGQSQSTTTTEVRWQPIPQTDTVTGQWEVVGSTTRVDQSKPTPKVARFQEVRTDLYRQRTTTYPLEAKEQRIKTTTTQDYELKTYAEQSTSSTVMVPVAKVVGEWVTKTEDKPVTTPIQVISEEPVLTPVEVPVYKTVTATYSIPGEPVSTTIRYFESRKVPKEETVTKEKTETYTTTQRVRYNGRMYDASSGKDMGRVVTSDDERGITVYCPDKNLSVYMTFANPEKTKLTYTVEGGWGNANKKPTLDGNCVVTRANGRHYLEFDCDPRYAFWKNWWGERVKVKLNNYLAYDKEVQAERKVTYDETVTKYVNTPFEATCSIWLETMTNRPQDREGTAVSEGVYWKHYHVRNGKCAYRPIKFAFSYDVTTFTVVANDSPELAAAKERGSKPGNLASRIEAMDPEQCKAALGTATPTLVYHHTDALPIFEDDRTATTIGTKQEDVFDHYEQKSVWVSKPHMVTKQVPVQTVIRWDDMGPRFEFGHSHDDPTFRCDNQYLKTPPSGNQSGRNQPGVSLPGGRPAGWGSNGSAASLDPTSGSLTIRHSRMPVIGPLTEKITSTTWATHSEIVMEPRTVTSTCSVLVGTVPGQDISTAYSPWTATGEKRHAGSGSTQDATRSVDVAGPAWTQYLSNLAIKDPEPVRAQSASYTSDMNAGNGRQTISGTTLRDKLKTKEALASKPQAAPTTGGSNSHRQDDDSRDKKKRSAEAKIPQPGLGNPWKPNDPNQPIVTGYGNALKKLVQELGPEPDKPNGNGNGDAGKGLVAGKAKDQKEKGKDQKEGGGKGKVKGGK